MIDILYSFILFVLFEWFWKHDLRCVVASRDILAGELLLEDYPVVFGPKDQYLGKYRFGLIVN